MNWDDPDMISDFLVEAEEHLDEIDSLLLELDSDGSRGKLWTRITGTFHTIKGMASYVDFKEVQQVCHKIESVLTAENATVGGNCRSNTDLAFDVVSCLRKRFGQLSDCLESDAQLTDSPEVAAMLSRLSQITASQAPSKRRA